MISLINALDRKRDERIKELEASKAQLLEAIKMAEHELRYFGTEVAALEALIAKLLAACKALQMEAAARHCGLRIADEAIAEAEARRE